jgi:hypothetical protein
MCKDNQDIDTLNRMRDILINLFDDGRDQELIDVLRLIYGILGYKYPEDVKQIAQHSESRHYFLFSFMLDFDDVLLDYTSER